MNRGLLLLLLGIVVLSFRAHGISARPMHADEANQAVRTGILLETGRYTFDPADHHGPTLYYGAAALALTRGQRTLASLDETTLRLVPAAAFALCAVLTGALASRLGTAASLAAGAFVAVSPSCAYYGGFFIQESLLCAFTLGFAWAALRAGAEANLVWVIVAGAFAGLMIATKESALVWIGAAAVALLLAGGRFPPVGRIATAAATALGVAVLLYTSFGTHVAGAADAVRALGLGLGRAVSGDTGHEKPWWYYARLLVYWSEDGFVLQGLAFAGLAAAGAWVGLRRGITLLKWAFWYALIVLIALSAVPYKTPWQVIHVVPPLALLAAGYLAVLAREGRPVTAAAIAVLVLFLTAIQARRVCTLYAADARNPFAYVHSSPDVLKASPFARAALARESGGIIRVISEEAWPLPWYLRQLDRVGYWTQVPEDCDAALVFASADLAPEVRRHLNGPYRVDYLGLRPGFVLVVFQRGP